MFSGFFVQVLQSPAEYVNILVEKGKAVDMRANNLLKYI